MKIEWNKVTWYSKWFALALFVVLPFIGFWFGAQYGKTVALSENPANGQPIRNGTTSGQSAYYSNVAEWQTDKRSDGGFSIAYPPDFNANDIYSGALSPDWRINVNGETGIKMFAVTIPRAFEPQTNFVDATLTIGKSSGRAAVMNCLQPDQSGSPGSSAATRTVSISGSAFWIFKSEGAGAGNFHETTSYRTIHKSICYAVEYTIHSDQIANYPAEYHLQPFDRSQLIDVLERIVRTLHFL